MKLTSFYPVVMVSDVDAGSRFFAELFGFAPAFVSEWYIHLKHSTFEDVELAILDGSHETIPAAYRGRVAGLLLNFEVEDAASVYDELKGKGAEMLLELRDEPFGQRHFIVRGPEGIMIDVITPIPPDAEYAANYL